MQRQVMSPQEYRRRLPFGWVRNLSTPDEDQEARARRVAEAIRQSGNPVALPLLWVDDEAIHQDVLQRELILPDDTDPTIRQAAIMRWNMLAQQAMMKMAGMPPQLSGQGSVAPGGGGGGGKGSQLSPNEQPFLATNPAIASAPAQELTQTEQGGAARRFEAGAAQ